MSMRASGSVQAAMISSPGDMAFKALRTRRAGSGHLRPLRSSMVMSGFYPADASKASDDALCARDGRRPEARG